MVSEISRLRAISSKLEDVAFAICSSKAVFEANQPAMMKPQDFGLHLRSVLEPDSCFYSLLSHV